MAFPGTNFTSPAVAQTATLSRLAAQGAAPTAQLGSEGTIWYILANIFTSTEADKYFATKGGSTFTGSVLVSNSQAGIGYSSGAGGTVTQATSKVTAFTLNTITGRIILNNSALAGSCTSSSATWTCSAMASTDVVVFTQNSGSLGAYTVGCVCSAGQGQFYVANASSGSLSEAAAFSYAIIKAVQS